MASKKILGTTVVSYKYQITIPKRVRNTCKFKEGDLVVFEQEGDRLYIKTDSEE